MLAFVLDEARRLAEVPAPVPGPREALVRVLMAGICGTDHELLSGYRAFHGIPGHEMVGVVEKASDTSWIGARVVSEINIGCGTCSLCARGLDRHCANRQVLGIEGRGGAFAELLTTPVENLHRVPDSITDEEAVWVEPLAAALAVWEAGIEPGENVLVLGDGRLGTLIALGLRMRGAQVEVAGKHEQKLSLLRSLELPIVQGGPRPIYPWVVEATGSPEGIERARAWTRPRGTVILKSTSHRPSRVETSQIVVDELRLVGSRCGDFEPALETLAAKAIPVSRLVSKTYPFREIDRALEESASPNVFKVLLDLRNVS
jgi:threonine dehydrogenase-like Zn-dependent dehydrogenase